MDSSLFVIMHKIRNLKVCYNSPTKSSSVLKEESSLTTTLVSLILTGLFNTSLCVYLDMLYFSWNVSFFIQVFKLIGILFIILLLKEFHSTSCFCNFLPHSLFLLLFVRDLSPLWVFSKTLSVILYGIYFCLTIVSFLFLWIQ